jgi:transmembrane sensor
MKDQVNKYKEIFERYEVPFNKSEDQALAEIERKIAVGIKAREVKVVGINWLRVASIAASVIIVAGAVFFMSRGGNDVLVTASAGTTKEVSLPDGSVVLLNAASEISYNDDWSKERVLNLSGEAFFDVVKGGKFLVKTSHGSVEVLGTSFDVFAREEKFDVKCFTGKVAVSSQNQSVVLSPGEEINFEQGKLLTEKFVVSQTDWRNDIFEYEQESIRNVIFEVERQFNVRIDLQVNDKNIDFKFSKQDGLDNTLNSIRLPYGYAFSKEQDGRIVIREKK